MSTAIGLAVSVSAAASAAGVTVPQSLASVEELYARISRANGTAVAGGTTSLRLQSRATPSVAWLDINETLGNDPTLVDVPVRDLRVIGVVDAADDPVLLSLFGRQP